MGVPGNNRFSKCKLGKLARDRGNRGHGVKKKTIAGINFALAAFSGVQCQAKKERKKKKKIIY